MHIDKTTLQDLSIFKGSENVFTTINNCETHLGASQLRALLHQPPDTYEKVMLHQKAVQYWLKNKDQWPKIITNGTVVMLGKFFESTDHFSYSPKSVLFDIDNFFRKIFNKSGFKEIEFSAQHLIEFLKGCREFISIKDEDTPLNIQSIYDSFEHLLSFESAKHLLQLQIEKEEKKMVTAIYQARRELKKPFESAFIGFAKLDMWSGMAKTTKIKEWVLPTIVKNGPVILNAKGLHHPLLKNPKTFEVNFNQDQYFMFLTGANMSGKSTLIRSMGIATLLSHIGMGVPAQSFEISYLDGIITNMQVEDNIILGESYFYAEVQRMKLTAERIHNNKRQLILMDELFKGTNIHDAYECSKAVIDGLITNNQNIMALSTHLCELYESLKDIHGIMFRYCKTDISIEGKYSFTYELKEGVSNDKIGYLVLKHEGVLDLLTNKRS